MGIYALIKDSVVVNTIKAEADFVPSIVSSYDACIEISEISPRPGPGWAYSNGTFNDPAATPQGEPNAQE